MDFKAQLKNAETELLKLEQQKMDIERQMHGWIKVIEGLRVLNDRERYRLDDIPTREESVVDAEAPSLPSKVYL